MRGRFRNNTTWLISYFFVSSRELIKTKEKNKRQETLDQLDFDPESGETIAYNSRVVALTTKRY